MPGNLFKGSQSAFPRGASEIQESLQVWKESDVLSVERIAGYGEGVCSERIFRGSRGVSGPAL